MRSILNTKYALYCVSIMKQNKGKMEGMRHKIEWTENYWIVLAKDVETVEELPKGFKPNPISPYLEDGKLLLYVHIDYRGTYIITYKDGYKEYVMF